MSFIKQDQPGNLGSSIIIDMAANTTAQNNVFGGACVLYAVMIDATENTKEDVYLKMDDDVTIASAATKPALQFFCQAGSTMQYTIPEGIAKGAGLSYYLSITTGSEAIAGAKNPTGVVKVYLVGT